MSLKASVITRTFDFLSVLLKKSLKKEKGAFLSEPEIYMVFVAVTNSEQMISWSKS